MATITSPRPQSPAPVLRTQNATNSPQPPTSPSITPTSSLRPSLDSSGPQDGRAGSPVTTPGLNGGPTPLQNPAQRRNRTALRDYYNLKSKAPQGTSQPERGSLSRTSSIASTSTVITNTNHDLNASDNDTASILPSSIDETSFDAASYVQHLLRTSSLQTLLKTEAALISEIKQLDGERKALVYDNYSKLIGATKMIGQMQRAMNEGAVDEGDAALAAGFAAAGLARPTNGMKGGGGVQEVEHVKGMVEDIVAKAAELRGHQSDRVANGETRSHDRNGSQPDKAPAQKRALVRWVIDAPARFERLASRDNHLQLEAEWGQLDPVLMEWDGVQGVAEIRSSCLATTQRNGSRKHDADGTPIATPDGEDHG